MKSKLDVNSVGRAAALLVQLANTQAAAPESASAEKPGRSFAVKDTTTQVPAAKRHRPPASEHVPPPAPVKKKKKHGAVQQVPETPPGARLLPPTYLPGHIRETSAWGQHRLAAQGQSKAAENDDVGRARLATQHQGRIRIETGLSTGQPGHYEELSMLYLQQAAIRQAARESIVLQAKVSDLQEQMAHDAQQLRDWVSVTQAKEAAADEQILKLSRTLAEVRHKERARQKKDAQALAEALETAGSAQKHASVVTSEVAEVQRTAARLKEENDNLREELAALRNQRTQAPSAFEVRLGWRGRPRSARERPLGTDQMDSRPQSRPTNFVTKQGPG